MISGVASDKNTSRVSVIGVQDKPGVAFKIFNTLAKKGINVDIILQSVGRGGTKDISFTVSQEDLNDTLKTLEENKESLRSRRLNIKIMWQDFDRRRGNDEQSGRGGKNV